MTSVLDTARGWFSASAGSLDDFRRAVERVTDPADYPFADSVESNVPIYRIAANPADRQAIREELLRALSTGPGVVVFRNAFDGSVVDAASASFDVLIAAQRADGSNAGDHFGAPGASDRIWNAAQKLALAAPDVFADYYANDLLALVCQAWLGPVYQVTSQVNVVNPGAAAQVPHRDYHLGIVRDCHLAEYPVQLHRMSAALTLQGAVAHCDMPVGSGPTMLLPYSQTFEPGYIAFRRPEFVDYFRAHHVALPLAKGDAIFFNPALFHGAGHNRSAAIRRSANLLQISSPFGRAMEVVDRTAMCTAVYPELLRLKASGLDRGLLHNIVVATAECYPFPTNLDNDPPGDRLAPPSQVDIVWDALEQELPPTTLSAALAAQSERRKP
ncbi:phytanoyl-CoA dioxygenase family protein [Antrihabitans sp. YC2-6]|uniref:phytanoyl-CoA dioxygenase family protein n=1 Tax=Antrihabitans sp. YC2-6 TaxID=2799498 RepID=UPI0018F3D173|nr:phytanoyl-CoA dioxygenase family protein [Antrihabitans sp. YC2-6]MBJ8344760.1 phytanoyl-CoA dioxygenase family protein [Antrihabitans sp. YC2-6]